MGVVKNIAAFRKTEKAIAEGGYERDGARVDFPCSLEEMSKVRFFSENDVLRISYNIGSFERRFDSCAITVKDCDSFSCAAELIAATTEEDEGLPLVLNFANPRTPGGEVKVGASAQEEDLCRASTLYASLSSETAKAFYEENRHADKKTHSHGVLVSPCVQVFRDSEGAPLTSPFAVAVISSPAPIARGTNDREMVARTIKTRVLGILSVAAHCGYTRLVLGAWGCGAFGNDPALVAESFKEALEVLATPREGESPDAPRFPFCAVSFAVLDGSSGKETFRAFEERFR